MKKWEEQFMKVWKNQFVSHVQDPADIINFIKQNFISREEIIELVEGMKKDFKGRREPHITQRDYGYNLALDDIIQSLEDQ